jgi:hypothetical protein
MGYTVTSFRRRLVMGALLGLAASGGVIRHYAPNPSTLRDIGTLLLVLWLPAVGNLIAYVIRIIPRSAPPVTEFTDGAAFVPQLEIRLDTTGASADVLAAVDPLERACTLLVARHGFTARADQPVAQALAAPGAQALAIQLLHPKVALGRLQAGTEFHLLVGTAGVAKGIVTRVLAG